MFNLLKSVTTSLLHLGLLLPLLLLVKFRYNKNQKYLLLLAALLILIESLIATSFEFTLFPKEHWNWTGRSASLIASVLFVYFNSILSKNDIGFTRHFKPFSWYPVLVISILLLFLRLIPKLIAGNIHPFNNIETFAFQTTLPGLSEEFFYRGILLGLLNKVYPTYITIFKAKIGWAF